MQMLTELWNGMSGRRRGAVVGGLLAVAAIVAILARMAAMPQMALLYGGLEEAAAGEVVAALDARGVAYDVRGGAIYVPQGERDALRLALAGEGLPAQGAAGYELLDTLTGFGTTAQMFDAAMARAREGELARTIMASPAIVAARVHISAADDSPFAAPRPATASVTLRPRDGTVSAAQARALRFLVASAVPQLAPEDVAVIDADTGRLVADADDQAGPAGSARADALRRNIERLIGARVGPGNVVVEVAVETWDTEEVVVEREVDPSSRVVVATDREERSDSSQGTGGPAGVTVASNLPTGDAEAGAGASSTTQTSETRERVEYDLSALQREVQRPAGALRRISVAVLVATPVGPGPDGVLTPTPRGDAELAVLADLVQSAVGYDPGRGDRVEVREMVFAEPVPGDLPAPVAGGAGYPWLIPVLALAVVAVAVLAFVVRPALRGTALTAAEPEALPAADPASTAPAIGLPRPGSVDETAVAPPPEDPVARLRRLISEREDDTVEILRAWIESDEEVT